MQTHVVTSSVLKRMSLAKRQLLARNIPFFVNFLIGDGPRDACPPSGSRGSEALALLRTTLGSESVWCIDPSDHEAVWPNFFNGTVASLAGIGPTRTAYPKTSAIAGVHWSWLFCDVHAIVGALRNRIFAAQTPPDFLWVFDYDISWVGDLSAFIDAFAADPADLLVARSHGQALAHKNHDNNLVYSQFGLRTYLSDEQVHSALLAPVRYSRRMLAATRGLLHGGQGAFCETRGASLCAMNRWCQQGSMMELRPRLFNANFSCCKSHSERYSRERWAMWEDDDTPGRPPVQLLHRVKLEGPPVGTASTLRVEGGKSRNKNASRVG